MSIVDNVLAGMDDLFSSFEEDFTQARRTELMQHRDLLGRLSTNVNQFTRFLHDALESLGDVAMLEASRIDAFHKVFQIRRSDTQAGKTSTETNILTGTRTVGRTAQRVLSTLKHSATCIDWTLKLSHALSSPVVKSSNEGIEMVVMGAAKATTAANTSRSAAMAASTSKYAVWADKLGVYAASVALVVKTIERVLAAIEIGTMRDELAKCKRQLSTLETNLNLIKTDAVNFVTDHRKIYAAHCPDGLASYAIDLEEGSKYSAEDFYLELTSALHGLWDRTAENMAAYCNVVLRLSHRHHLLAASLRNDIQANRDALIAFEAKLPLAIHILHNSGTPTAELVASLDLPEQLLTLLAERIPAGTAFAGKRPVLTIADDGGLGCHLVAA